MVKNGCSQSIPEIHLNNEQMEQTDILHVVTNLEN